MKMTACWPFSLLCWWRKDTKPTTQGKQTPTTNPPQPLQPSRRTPVTMTNQFDNPRPNEHYFQNTNPQHTRQQPSRPPPAPLRRPTPRPVSYPAPDHPYYRRHPHYPLPASAAPSSHDTYHHHHHHHPPNRRRRYSYQPIYDTRHRQSRSPSRRPPSSSRRRYQNRLPQAQSHHPASQQPQIGDQSGGSGAGVVPAAAAVAAPFPEAEQHEEVTVGNPHEVRYVAEGVAVRDFALGGVREAAAAVAAVVDGEVEADVRGGDEDGDEGASVGVGASAGEVAVGRREDGNESTLEELARETRLKGGDEILTLDE